MKYPANLAISRDGKQLAYWLDKQIYVVPLAGGTPRAVTSAGSSAWDPYWSKDGSTLYFLSDRSGTSQLWKLPLADFGEAQQVTTFEQGIDRLRFSPDESRLLLGFTDSALQAPAKTEDGKEPSPKPFVITRLEFKEDAGDGYLTGDRAEHLHALDIATGKTDAAHLRRLFRIRCRLVRQTAGRSSSPATASRNPTRPIAPTSGSSTPATPTRARRSCGSRTTSGPRATRRSARTAARSPSWSPKTASTARRRSR